MAESTDIARYGATAQVLHWTTLALVAAQPLLAELAEEMGRGGEAYAAHRSVGLSLLALTVLRIAWRFVRPPPAPPPMPQWQRVAAACTHWGLYLLLLAIPVSGWLMSSASGDAVAWLGVELPALVAPSADLAESLEDAHETLFQLLLALVGLHVAAALKHQFLDRDGLIRRMLPRLGRG